MLTPGAGSGLAEAFFQHIDFSGGAVAAVSGGSDSIALLVLLKHHLDRAFPAAPLLAVTVDHALRPGSGAEAAGVAAFCAARGIPHRIMVWRGEKPAQGLPAAAREARYRLLAEAAAQSGIAAIATGHTADDQAETVLMRQARGGGDGRGLAGMAPATLYGGKIWIVRPLLGVRRATLRAMLRGEGIAWAEDPTNVDKTFERPRTRAALAADEGKLHAALALAESSARARLDLGLRAAALIRAHAGLPCAGLMRLAPAFAAVPDREAAIYALRILLATAGGTRFLPDQRVAAALLEGIGAGPLRATLSRVVADSRRSGIFLYREGRGLPPVSRVSGGSIWDGRRRITFGDAVASAVIAPLGAVAAAASDAEVAGVARSLVRRALAAEPVPFGTPGPPPSGLESIARFAALPVAAPFLHFLSCLDLAPAGAVAALIGAAAIPPPPLRGHFGSPPCAEA